MDGVNFGLVDLEILDKTFYQSPRSLIFANVDDFEALDQVSLSGATLLYLHSVFMMYVRCRARFFLFPFFLKFFYSLLIEESASHLLGDLCRKMRCLFCRIH